MHDDNGYFNRGGYKQYDWQEKERDRLKDLGLVLGEEEQGVIIYVED